jgi:hypothetical protein
VGVADLGMRDVVRPWNRVVHERAGEQMPVAIEHCVFHHHLAPALGERAFELTVGQQRVHDRAGVVEPYDERGRDDPGVAGEAHRDDEGARAPDLALGGEKARGPSPGSVPGGNPVPR